METVRTPLHRRWWVRVLLVAAAVCVAVLVSGVIIYFANVH